jgi:cytochrome c-type biogenesis protein CcmF
VTRLIGASAVMVALALSLAGIVFALSGARRQRRDLLQGAYAVAYTNFALLGVATLAMVWALVTHDFSVSYVAQVGSRATPPFYTVISLWGALEGSILFWGFVLAAYTAAVVYFNRHRGGAMVPYATATLLGIGVFFYVLLVLPANPFHLVSPTPADGPGPNPLLQNHPLMAVHPPLLYLGYVGMSVPFAFAVGALLSRAPDDEWIRTTRRWTVTAWMFLTAAIIAGMWWSYEVLGWGGYWAWDPVENASFMPWLTATAFLHSVMVEERRGMLRIWNLSLVTATFLLTILGTFLTRSGVLSSVHAFSEGPIGKYFLVFIAIVFVSSLGLIAGRSSDMQSRGKLDAAVSRETVFLLNNLLFTLFTFTVLLGTLFPLVAEAVSGAKVSVGGPFFNKMTLPICMGLLFLMGVGPALPWRAASRDTIKRELLLPGGVAVLVAIASIVLGARNVFAILAFSFAAFALFVNVRQFTVGARARMRAHGEAPWTALVRLVAGNRRRYGGFVAHIGAIVAAVAIAASSAFRSETEATLKKGETMTLRGFTIRLDEIWAAQEPQRFTVGTDVSLVRGGAVAGRLSPRLNFYATSDQPISTPAVRSRAAGDLYLNLMAFERDGSTATIRMIVEPLVPWIWTGGMIIVLGAALSSWPARKRAGAPARVAIAGQGEAGGGGGGGKPLIPTAAPIPVRSATRGEAAT